MAKLLLLFSALFPLWLHAAVNDSLKPLNDPKKPGKTYSWVFLSAGYRLPVHSGNVINSGRGVFIEAGVNPGKLISGKLLTGVFVGWGWKDNLWHSGFHKQFTEDYKASINHEQPGSFLDSSIVAASPGLFNTKKGRSPSMPGCEMTSFHNYSVYYGVVIKLPFRYLPALKLYRGSTRSHYQGPDGMITSGNDYNIIQLRRSMYGCEIMALNPLQIFYKHATPACVQRVGISAYYEYCDFYTSALYFDDSRERRHIPLKAFVSNKLLKKYAHENLYGFKLSYNLY